MPSLASRRLTEAHRLAQLRIGVRTIADLRRVWRLLDPDNLDPTIEAWIAAAAAVIRAQHSDSSALAMNYLDTFKRLELGDTATIQRADPPMAGRAVATSLIVTGPLSIKRAMTRGVPLERAVRTAEAASSAAGMRHALQGGRDSLLESLRSDPDAAGWSRVASGNACKFCSSLDGKFHRAETADFPAHDGCSCSQEPVYR